MSERTDGGQPDERRPHERHEPDLGHEPTHEQEHTQSHAGNGTVNHGPDEKGPEGLGPGLDGLASDELDLRRMLQSAVDDIEPRTGTLDHLRRAVPARRARKRQAAVGMAAAALFIGTAIPALIHVSNSGGTDPNTAMAGQSSEAQGGATQGKDPDGGSGTVGGKPGKTTGPGRSSGKPGKQGGTGDHGTGSTGGANPSASAAADAPPCTAAQLGSATQSAGAPDSTGVVYGTFHLTNTSATACTVGGPGTVGVTAQGAADPAKIGSARHVSGDPAAGLPDPSVEVATLVLQPGAAYEEKFAFVPSETCPTTGGTPGGGSDTGGPSPDPSPTPDAGGAAGSDGGTDTTGTTGVTTQLGTEDGAPADGSVLVTHTAQAGTTVSATVGDACAGTVYYTGVLAGA